MARSRPWALLGLPQLKSAEPSRYTTACQNSMSSRGVVKLAYRKLLLIPLSSGQPLPPPPATPTYNQPSVLTLSPQADMQLANALLSHVPKSINSRHRCFSKTKGYVCFCARWCHLWRPSWGRDTKPSCLVCLLACRPDLCMCHQCAR